MRNVCVTLKRDHASSPVRPFLSKIEISGNSPVRLSIGKSLSKHLLLSFAFVTWQLSADSAQYDSAVAVSTLHYARVETLCQ